MVWELGSIEVGVRPSQMTIQPLPLRRSCPFPVRFLPGQSVSTMEEHISVRGLHGHLLDRLSLWGTKVAGEEHYWWICIIVSVRFAFQYV